MNGEREAANGQIQRSLRAWRRASDARFRNRGSRPVSADVPSDPQYVPKASSSLSGDRVRGVDHCQRTKRCMSGTPKTTQPVPIELGCRQGRTGDKCCDVTAPVTYRRIVAPESVDLLETPSKK